MFNLLMILFVNLYDLGWMFVLLKKLFELWIFKNLIVCLYVFLFNDFIFNNFLWFLNLFILLWYLIMFCVCLLFKFEINFNILVDVVFKLILIKLIVLFILNFKVCESFFWFILYWYCLILIDFGLILISLLRGFWNFLLILIVFFFLIFKLGNFLIVILEVE